MNRKTQVDEIGNVLEEVLKKQIAFARKQIESELSNIPEDREVYSYVGKVFTKLSQMGDSAFYNLIVRYKEIVIGGSGNNVEYQIGKYSTVGEAIKDMRTQLNETQESIARGSRVSNKTINEWEQEVERTVSKLNKPNRKALERVAKYFNLSEEQREHFYSLSIRN